MCHPTHAQSPRSRQNPNFIQEGLTTSFLPCFCLLPLSKASKTAPSACFWVVGISKDTKESLLMSVFIPHFHIMRHWRAPGLQVGAPVTLSVQFTTRIQRNCLTYSSFQCFIFFLPNCLHLFGDFNSLHGYDCRFLFSSEPLSYSQLSIIFFFLIY